MARRPFSTFRLLRRTVSAVAFAILVDALRKSARKRALLALLTLLTLPAGAQNFGKRVIIISVDGLRPDVIESFDASLLPAFHRLQTEGAFTMNARSDPQFTITMPNHASMMTGRWVQGSGSHGWAYNDDAGGDRTIHENKTEYVPSIWDVAHDEGARTALFATKEKFAMYDRSWNEEHGAADLTTSDFGKDKIDSFVYQEQSQDMVDAFLSEATTSPPDLAFLHIADPDREGHATGWLPTMGSAYTAAIMHADQQVGRVLDFISSDANWKGTTWLIVTADHGGTALSHSDPLVPEHYRVPFFVWGPKVDGGSDLYAINTGRRSDPGTAHVAQTVAEMDRPIQNADAANVALGLLGLPAIPRSPIGRDVPLLVRARQEVTDGTRVMAFQDGVSPSPTYAGTRDTKLHGDAQTTAFGSSDYLEIDANPDYAALLQWDLSAVPSGATVQSAEIVFHVTNVSTATYQLYALNKPWDESSATWLERNTGEPWTLPGATSDHASTVLANVRGPNLGELRIPFTSSGLNVLQGWLTDPASNYGFIILNYDTVDDGLDVSSREAVNPSLRPRLELTYAMATTVEQPVAPQALFQISHERGASRGAVAVDAAASMLDGTSIVSWVWDFGDNTTAIGPAAVHSYQLPGTYQVSLTVIDSTGVEDRRTRIVIIDEAATGSASFQRGAHPLPLYSDAIDTRLQSDAQSTNFGSDTSLLVDGSPFYAALLRFQLTAIAPGIEVTRASLALNVTNTTTERYDLYPMLSPWSEDEATWQQALTGAPWSVVGAGGTADHAAESMGTLTAGALGETVVEFNDVGRQWLANWINDPASNFGFVIQNYTNAQDGVDFLSAEAADPTVRPRLDISWQEPGLADRPVQAEFDVWPNPFRGDLNVTVNSTLPNPVALEIFDMLGRRVLRQTLDASSFGGARLDTSFLAAGVYALVLTDYSTRISTTKLVTRQ